MGIKITDEVTITRKRTVRLKGNHTKQPAVGAGKYRRKHGWHKEFYGKPMSRKKYFEILESWDSAASYNDPHIVLETAISCGVSLAMVLAVVQDRENYRARKKEAIEAKRKAIE